MRFDHLRSLYLSGGIFFILLVGGFNLSEHKLLWTDELYTQQTAIDAHSYMGLLSLKFPDGNKNPLFYVIQKTVCHIFSYHLPVYFPREIYSTRDIPSQIILRIPSDFYMSLALAFIFYFFTRFYSIFAALYALCVALATPMVWMYWVEARPYPLWFLLTTIQLLLLLSFVVISPKIKKVKSIFLVHVLLAFTTPASMFQISIVALMLWWKGRTNIKQLGLIWALPMGIALFYYFFDRTATIKTYMFSSNLFDAVMPERLFVYVIYALMAWVLPEKYKKISWNAFFLPVFLLFLASGLLVLFVDLFTKNSGQGFFSRYLIYLAPPDILMFSLASFDLRQWSRQNPWICLNVSIILGGLVIVRGLMTYREILASAIYLHSPG
jgi:hypothetical protein